MSIAKRLLLRDNHPTAEKVSKLYALADELGISFSFFAHRTVVEDRDRDPNLPTLYMEDVENGDSFNEFPPTTEYKLVYDNPEYLEQQRKENEERQAKAKAEAEEREQRRLKKEKEETAAKLKQEKERELAEFERLKKKYG